MNNLSGHIVLLLHHLEIQERAASKEKKNWGDIDITLCSNLVIREEV